jgi:hypothetical protein
MRMWIQHESGTKVEALLLAASRYRMRVVVAGQRDTIDLNRLGDCWYAESGQAIEIEALIPVAGSDCAAFCTEVYPQTMSAGRNFPS